MISAMGTGDLRVLVLAGGLSYERDVSLRSGRRVLDALRSAGVEAQVRDADVSLLPSLETDPPDAVVIALHGATGGIANPTPTPTAMPRRRMPASRNGSQRNSFCVKV